MRLSEVNLLSPAEAEELLGGVFEHSSWIVAETWNQAPFATLHTLHAALVATVEHATSDQQLALIRAHPDLVGRAAQAGTLTRESTVEQQVAGLSADNLSAEEVTEFRHLNREYTERFGFPFVICARENKKASILAGFATRLPNDPDTERQSALREISRIAWYRLADLIEN